MSMQNLWGKRSRFEACSRKLEMLRAKRGVNAEGDLLLQAAQVSIENGNAAAGAEDLRRYELVTNLNPEERALVHSIRYELRATSSNRIYVAWIGTAAETLFKFIAGMAVRKWFPLIYQVSMIDHLARNQCHARFTRTQH